MAFYSFWKHNSNFMRQVRLKKYNASYEKSANRHLFKHICLPHPRVCPILATNSSVFTVKVEALFGTHRQLFSEESFAVNLCIKDIKMFISFFIIHEEEGDGKDNKMQLHLLLKCFVQKPRSHLSANLAVNESERWCKHLFRIRVRAFTIFFLVSIIIIDFKTVLSLWWDTQLSKHTFLSFFFFFEDLIPAGSSSLMGLGRFVLWKVSLGDASQA